QDREVVIGERPALGAAVYRQRTDRTITNEQRGKRAIGRIAENVADVLVDLRVVHKVRDQLGVAAKHDGVRLGGSGLEPDTDEAGGSLASDRMPDDQIPSGLVEDHEGGLRP